MRANVALKALIVGVVAGAFIVPLIMIWGVVRDRSRYRVDRPGQEEIHQQPQRIPECRDNSVHHHVAQ